MNDESLIEAREFIDNLVEKAKKEMIVGVISLVFALFFMGIFFQIKGGTLVSIIALLLGFLLGSFAGVLRVCIKFSSRFETSEERKERLKERELKMEIAKEAHNP